MKFTIAILALLAITSCTKKEPKELVQASESIKASLNNEGYPQKVFDKVQKLPLYKKALKDPKSKEIVEKNTKLMLRSYYANLVNPDDKKSVKRNFLDYLKAVKCISRNSNVSLEEIDNLIKSNSLDRDDEYMLELKVGKSLGIGTFESDPSTQDCLN